MRFQLLARLLMTRALPLFLLPAMILLLPNETGIAGAWEETEAGTITDVNTFIGTAGPDAGATFPGATMPFGMVQWSPDTSNGFTRKNVGSYQYSDDMIRDFSLTHLSGPGCPVLGDIPIQPFEGEIKTSPAIDPAIYRAKFSHSNEQASPGYYAVRFDNGIRVELAATLRGGMGKFEFPASENSTLIFDLGRNATEVFSARVEIEAPNEISGSVSSGAFCHSTNRYKIYFTAEFNRAFSSYGAWSGADLNRGTAHGGRRAYGRLGEL